MFRNASGVNLCESCHIIIS